MKNVPYNKAYSDPQKTFKFTYFLRNDFWEKRTQEKWWTQMKGGIMGYSGERAYTNAEMVQKILRLISTYHKKQICFELRLMTGTKIKRNITNCKLIKTAEGYIFKLVPIFIGKDTDANMPLSDSY